MSGEIGDFFAPAIERMAGDVDAENFLFTGEFLLHSPVGQFSEGMLFGVSLIGTAEEAVLAAGSVASDTHAGFESAVERFGKLGSIAAEQIESAGADQTFNHAAIDSGEVDAFTEVVDRCENAAFFTGGHDGFDSALPYVFDCAEAEANGVAGGSEVEVTLVDVGAAARGSASRGIR